LHLAQDRSRTRFHEWLAVKGAEKSFWNEYSDLDFFWNICYTAIRRRKSGGEIRFRPPRPSNHASEGFRASASVNDATRRTGEEKG
jgi:hypothetical protein